MSNKVTWSASPTSRTATLGTELNSLASGAFSAASGVIDNTTNLDKYAAVAVHFATFSPTGVAYFIIYLLQSLDGTLYDDTPGSTNPGWHMAVARCSITAASGTKDIMTPWFQIPPGKFKLSLYHSNGGAVALNASGNTGTLYTSDDLVN